MLVTITSVTPMRNDREQDVVRVWVERKDGMCTFSDFTEERMANLQKLLGVETPEALEGKQLELRSAVPGYGIIFQCEVEATPTRAPV